MIDLKPCPFCGGEAQMKFGIDGDVSCIWCKSCKAMTHWTAIKTQGHEPFGVAMDKYAAAWNQRVADEMEDDLK